MGIPDGIGMLKHPDKDNIVSNNNSANTTPLSLFLNFKISPLDLYYTAQDKSFCKLFSPIL